MSDYWHHAGYRAAESKLKPSIKKLEKELTALQAVNEKIKKNLAEALELLEPVTRHEYCQNKIEDFLDRINKEQ